MTAKRRGLISIFTRHRVAANLLMISMIISGIWALTRLNVQFLPKFDISIVTVQVIWPGASAEDIENSITNPLEREFRNLDSLKRINSTSRNSSAMIYVRFNAGTNMNRALEEVRDRVSLVRNLPTDAEKPIITKLIPYETIAHLVTTGPHQLNELRPLVRQFERELLDNGIAKINIFGLPEEEIAIQIPVRKLNELNIPLSNIADRIAERSRDLPAGKVGRSELARQLRSLEQRRSVKQFENLPILSNAQGQLILLRDIATIERRPKDDEIKVYYKGQPAVEMRLLRTEDANALTSANILHQWYKKTKAEVGKSVGVHIYDQRWQYIQERINLLLKNGAGGLILIVGILFILLNRRVATWVVAGIPASFMAALAALYIYGGSINMVSLFALIMSLGIIVDDTIVIGEQTLTNIHEGQSSLEAVLNAAHKMLGPIMASSLTTICAFLPLFLVTGVMGQILFAIPLVVVCIILASLLECFLVLPGHLYHSFTHHRQDQEIPLREKINSKFRHFRDHRFRRLITHSLNYAALTVSLALAIFIVSIGLIKGGYVKFTFFPSPEGQILLNDIRFTIGTPEKERDKFLKQVNKALYDTEKEFKDKGESLLQTAITIKHFSRVDNHKSNQGDQYASIRVELVSPEVRNTSNSEFIAAWRKKISLPPGVEHFAIYAPRGGPPGEDIDVLFTGKDPIQLKKAAVDMATVLQSYPGVSNIKDDLPFGQEQLIYKINNTGKSLGLTIASVGKQLRAAFNGQIAQIFHEPNEEVEVRVMLPDSERFRQSTLEQFPIISNNNVVVPLGTVVDLSYRRGPDVLLHTDTKLGVHVTAKVDYDVNNANAIIADLNATIVPKLTKKYHLNATFLGKAEEQQETFHDMGYGLVLGITLIYIILAWVFNSYAWPLLVMMAIPLGLTGAIFGHLLMGLDLTILSLFGLFGLSGIVINDSIILVSEYRLLRKEDLPVKDAIIEASCRRLRAVLLTSLTTIAGLTPLLFESSVQAQFLIPMATSISFGLAYATLLILVVVPTSLYLYESYRHAE